MNDSERLAEKYLNSLGQGVFVFEPDGRVPPDFALGAVVGVEVRRLNQNYEFADGSIEGLEKRSISLWDSLEKLLPSLGPSINGETWFVGMDFRRPVESWKSQLSGKVKRELSAFMRRSDRRQCSIQISTNFKLDLTPASNAHSSFFLLGGSSDNDSGGWVLSEVERNLRICLAQKELKIAPYRSKYQQWWLVLDDHIGHGVSVADRETFRVEVMSRLVHSFDKVVLLDPMSYRAAFEL